jgi:urease accessory protein
MKRRGILLAGALGAFVPWAASAHPGHGHGDGWSLLHFVLEPVHGGAGILLAACLLAAIAWLRRTSGPR